MLDDQVVGERMLNSSAEKKRAKEDAFHAIEDVSSFLPTAEILRVGVG